MGIQDLSNEELLKQARAVGLAPPGETTAMEKLAEFGRGAVGDLADMGRAAIGATLEETIGPDREGATWGERYSTYKGDADQEEKEFALADPNASKNLRRAGMATTIAASAPAALGAARGLTQATRAALAKGAGRVGGSAKNAATAVRGAAGKPHYSAAQVAQAQRSGQGVHGLAKARQVAGKAASGPGANAGIGAATGALDEDATVAQGALEGMIFGGLAGKALSSEKVKAIKNLLVNSPVGRMALSQMAQRAGASGGKTATIWYALHPTSRKAIERAVAAVAGKED